MQALIDAKDIRWSKEQNGHESAPEYGLYSHNKEAMTSIASSLPILEPGA